MTTQLLAAPTAIAHPPRRLPFVGDVFTLDARNPVQSNMRWAKQLGPVFDRRLFGFRILFVTGPDIVAEISDETRFVKHLPGPLVAMRELAGEGLITAHSDEPNWRRAHDLLQPAFTQQAMRGYHAVMVRVADDLVRQWDAATGPVDVDTDMTKVTLETIGLAGFGQTFGGVGRTGTHPFADAMVAVARYTLIRTFLGSDGSGLLWRAAEARNRRRIDYLHRVVDDVIAQRYEQPSGADLLAVMLRAERDGDPNAIDRRNIREQVVTFMFAGHETTSSALSFALYYLSRDPAVLARAQAEVDAVWPDEGPPAFEHVGKLRYVRRVLDETLRLWPTAPAYAREPREDTVVGGIPIAAGEGMVVLIPALHRDDTVWGADAEEFDPDRFTSDRVKARPAHSYKPFGTGERVCIGRQFALHESVLVLGTILRRYDLVPEPGYRLAVTERMTLAPRGFRLRLRRR